MSSHGGGRRGSRGGGGRVRGWDTQRLQSPGERGRRGRGREGSVSPYRQESTSSYDLPESSSSRRTREYYSGESSGSRSPAPEAPSRPPVAASSASSSEAIGASLPPTSSKALVAKARPGFGTSGKKCRVLANHFVVRAADNNISQYEFKIHEDVKSKTVSRNLMTKLIEKFGELHIGEHAVAYDGRNIFYVVGALPFDASDFSLTLPDRDGQDRAYRVSIKFTKALDLYRLREFLRAAHRECPYDVIAALDVVMRETPSKSYLTSSRSFFSRDFGFISDQGLEYWGGFFQSLRPTQMGLSLNIDVSTTQLYEPINLLHFIRRHFRIDPFNQEIRRHHYEIQMVLKGVRVETTHMQNMRRCYKITGITLQSASDLKFTIENKGETSVADYFKDNYPNARINYSLPCIKAGSESKPKYLPIQVCKIVEGQRYLKKLNNQQLNQISKFTSPEPTDRKNYILETVEINNYNADIYVNAFGISVKPNLINVEARVLSAPTLKYNDSGVESTCQTSSGRWNMVNKRMLVGATIDAWACVNFSNLSLNIVQTFCHGLVSTCKNFGMAFKEKPVGIYFESSAPIEAYLRELHNKHFAALNPQLQLLIVILPDKMGSYGMIKTICETELGLVTQCCHPKKLQSRSPYKENLALKINVKAAGCNTALIDKQNLLSDKPTIIFGADVTHPSRGEDLPSIAAVVASIDWPQIAKYKALLSSQPRGQEIIEDLNIMTRDRDPSGKQLCKGMIRDLIGAFYRKTNLKPARIIFYRDGVSEGQLQQVLSTEIDAIRKACLSIHEEYRPAITFIVVQKRHHTRFFPIDERMTDSSGNILAGTVVDTQICHPIDFDFYLCSHAGIKGTSRPAHYLVLLDENKFSADELQGFTNDLCYTYARCTRSVSLVPPVYYAHLAAYRARYYMEVTRQRNPGASRLPEIIDRVSNVMYFC